VREFVAHKQKGWRPEGRHRGTLGLRTCEVRRLRLGEIDLESRRDRIEQSKWLKDRLVYVNSATLDALRTWRSWACR